MADGGTFLRATTRNSFHQRPSAAVLLRRRVAAFGSTAILLTMSTGIAADQLVGTASPGWQAFGALTTWGVPLGAAALFATRLRRPTGHPVRPVRPAFLAVTPPTARAKKSPAPMQKASQASSAWQRSSCSCRRIERLAGGVAVLYAQDHLLVVHRQSSSGQLELSCPLSKTCWLATEPWASQTGGATLERIERSLGPIVVAPRLQLMQSRRTASRRGAASRRSSTPLRPLWPTPPAKGRPKAKNPQGKLVR